MIHLEQITDSFELKYLLAKDSLYKTMIGIDNLDNWLPDLVFFKWYLALDGTSPVGVFYVRLLTDNCYSFHGGIYKNSRGIDSPSIVKSCFDHVREDTARVFISTVNSNNIAAIKLLNKLNFVVKTTIKNGYTDGDMLVFGEE